MKNKFSQLNVDQEILKAIENLGFKELTEIQEKAIPVAMRGENILGSSSTGSGKTLAFLIPVLEKTSWEENDANTLILAPSRELAVQIQNEYNVLGRYKRLSCVAVFGKQPFKEQAQALKNKHQAISGTPGRVLDHLERGTIDIGKITHLIIDEVDELLDRGFSDEVMAIVRKLPFVKQTMMFSATITEEVNNLAKAITKDFIVIEASKEEDLNISELHYRVDSKDKWKALLSIIYGKKPKAMIIFVNTKDECDRIQRRLEENNIDALKIHGGMMQDDRLKAMEKFKNKEVPYLVATDVASRGIDINDLDISLSYDFPVEKESYVHRKGRTGRNFEEGLAIYFVSEYDDRKFIEVENYVGHKLGDVVSLDYSPAKNDKDSFREFQKGLRQNRKKKVSVHTDIMKIYLNGGKKKKIRAIDFVGTINAIEGINPEDIGIIKIEDQGTYIDILNGKGELVIKELKTRKIKGKTLRVEKAHK